MKKAITIVLAATVVMLSTSTEIIVGKAEVPVKNKISFSSQPKEKRVINLSKMNIHNISDAVAVEEARIDKEKAEALAIEKAKQDELDRQAAEKKKAEEEAKALEIQKAEAIKQAEANRLAEIAASKARQAEIDRIAAERADAAKQAKIAENFRIAKAASDKAEADKLAKLEAARTAKIEAIKKAKIDRDALIKAGTLTQEEADKQAKIEADELAELEVEISAALGVHQTVTEAKFATFLSSQANISSVLNRAVELHNGDPSNTCVYFSSEAMRRIGVAVPIGTCNTKQYLAFLKAQGWVPTYDIRKLTPGSICFTTADWAGYPTHTFAFMGWVNSGDYTLANVADNQGNNVHVRNMGATDSTDAFAFFMHN